MPPKLLFVRELRMVSTVYATQILHAILYTITNTPMKYSSQTTHTLPRHMSGLKSTDVYVHTLIHYLNQHEGESAAIAAAVRDELPCPEYLPSYTHTTSDLLAPQETGTAIARVRWILHTPELARERDLLAAWAWSNEREEPKSIILGIKYGELPVGIWGKMKIKEDPMHLLISDGTELSPTETAAHVTQLSHDVLRQGILNANGNIRHVEPALGDWFFGSKPLMFFKAPTKTIARIAKDVLALEAPHAEACLDRGHILALTPAIDLRNHELYHELEQIETNC